MYFFICGQQNKKIQKKPANSSFFWIIGLFKFLKSRFRKSILFCRIKDSFYSASAVAILKTIIPHTKNKEIAPNPIFTFPVSCAMRLITVVPRKEAPFPHMSISPKYSPDFSAGMILVK